MLRRLSQKVVNAVSRRWRAVRCITSHVLPEERVGREVRRLTIVAPAGTVRIGWPDQDPFIPVGKYYRDGYFEQPAIFVAEIPRARLHVGSGLVCTPGHRALADAGRTDRVPCFSPFGRRKPRHVPKLSGAWSTIEYCYANNIWHWFVDCLPKLISLERALPDQALTLLMPDTMSPLQRESMLAVLPARFSVRHLPAETWVETETFYWPSLVSGRCNAFLPPGYWDEIRSRIFARYGLASRHCPRRRLYITRGNADKRRVLNEEAVRRLLDEYLFETIELENLTFRQEVELFHEAAFVIGPHGAGLAGTIFSGPITLVVFYSTPRPPNYFHTQACALGQRHRFLLHHGDHEDDDLAIDLDELRALLESELARSGAA